MTAAANASASKTAEIAGAVAALTAFLDLNAVLNDLVVGTKAALAESFCGAYLQGSFAVGDADEHNDVGFVVVTHAEITTHQLAALETMPKRLHALDVPWAEHLEGSYIP